MLLAIAPMGALAAGAAGSTEDAAQFRLRNETESMQGVTIQVGARNTTPERIRNETERQAGGAETGPADNATLFRQQIRDQERLLVGNQTPLQDRERVTNENRVRLAVHAFLLVKDEMGGLGQNVSAIAREFNNSVVATTRAEEQIRNRSGLVRFFAGGDEAAADTIEQNVIQNRNRIQQLAQLTQNCSCSNETRAVLREQIENLTQEQDRLQDLARPEREDRGLFGWLWK